MKPFLAKIYEGYGCIDLQIDGRQMKVEYYSDDGKTIDDFSIIKNNGNFNDFDSENNIHEASYNQYLKIKS